MLGCVTRALEGEVAQHAPAYSQELSWADAVKFLFYSFDGTKPHETSHMALTTLLVQKLASCLSLEGKGGLQAFHLLETAGTILLC